jgi:glutamine---fructose-6-phosphate transaminase (isomerizing)
MSDPRMWIEICEQPDMVARRAAGWEEQAEAARAALGEARNLVLVGRGSSGNACTFAAYLHGSRTGRQPIEFRPWLACVDGPRADWSDAVAWAFSVSGESTDIAGAARWLRERGARVLGITNAEGDCHLGAQVDRLYRLGAGPELAVPATKSLCAQLFAAAALSGAPVAAAASETAAAMRQILAAGDAGPGAELAGFLAGGRSVAWLARGPALAAALDGALKFQECAAMHGAAYSAAEFLHGPIGAHDERDRAVLFADGDGGATSDSLRAVGSALLARRVPFVVIGAQPEISATTSGVSLPVPMPAERWARSAIFAFVSQLAALALARRLGLDPDAPRGLGKVTLT